MIELQVMQPFPWQQLLHYLSFRLVPEFESVNTITINGFIEMTWSE